MGGNDSKQQEPTPPEPSSVPEPAPEPVKAVSPPVKETAKPTMSEPTAPPEAKEYPEFPGEKLSKRYAPSTRRVFRAHRVVRGCLSSGRGTVDADARDSSADAHAREARVHRSTRRTAWTRDGRRRRSPRETDRIASRAPGAAAPLGLTSSRTGKARFCYPSKARFFSVVLST